MSGRVRAGLKKVDLMRGPRTSPEKPVVAQISLCTIDSSIESSVPLNPHNIAAHLLSWSPFLPTLWLTSNSGAPAI
jgi:hypothetical protein